jgi:cell wall-associated NlpC family hydrolase
MGDPDSGPGIARRLFGLAFAACMSGMVPGAWQSTAQAQSAQVGAALGQAGNGAFAQTSNQASAAPAAPQVAANTQAGQAAANQSGNEDPVTRFLSDKGLLPNTRPVVELAQQVRDKASDMASELVLSAMNFLGVPYRMGGQSREQGFDCSGFTRHVFENSVGLILPRRASEQANSPELVPVQQAELKPGDLVFFNTLRHTFSHVGIYIGDNKFIHSPRAGGQVRVEDMRQAYWQQRFDGARRAPKVSTRQAAASPN